MANSSKIRLLYLTAEAWPTFRADVAVLFGKYLPRLGITTDLLTEQETAATGHATSWPGGAPLLFEVPHRRALFYPIKLWRSIRGLIKADANQYDAIQVRDMPVIAMFGLWVARLKGLTFFYWMSFPQSEGQVFRAKARGPKAGLKYWFPLLQGLIGQWILYKLVLPYADHIFVQSLQMVEDVAIYGIDKAKMTPVPMGVDLEISQANEISPSDDPRLTSKRIAVYLGTLDRARNIEILFEMLARAKASCPELILVLVGDTEDNDHRQWLKNQAHLAGVAEAVMWTGWLPTAKAWSYVKAAEVGLSPFPRSYLLDSASPTKAIEYMAVGLPVVVNDNPDQARAVTESGAGLCVPLNAESFATALLELLENSGKRAEMATKGKEYVAHNRGYDQIAIIVAETYSKTLGIKLSQLQNKKP
jgi:glycosyltransferase involved in cell wall biosynthesis